MNWTEKQHGNIKLVHYSTSSMIELIIYSYRQKEESIWMDYKEFKELKELMDEIDVE